jgi:hypothetical protein
MYLQRNVYCSQKDDCLFSIDLTDLETGIYTSGSVLEMKKT